MLQLTGRALRSPIFFERLAEVLLAIVLPLVIVAGIVHTGYTWLDGFYREGYTARFAIQATLWNWATLMGDVLLVVLGAIVSRVYASWLREKRARR